MTTEVAILNREAIALAADSAVTVNNGTKIYNSANKLFALSKNHPIGIMVYGNAQLTGVPWETLIKVYRNKLGNSVFPKLIDYCDHFINFLIENKQFFLEKDEKTSFGMIVVEMFENIQEDIQSAVKNAFEEQSKLSKDGEKRIIESIIQNYHQELEKAETLPSFDKHFVNEFSKTNKPVFEELINIVFDELPIDKKNKTKLLKIAVNSLVKKHFSSQQSGIVIAGFGEEEVFPSLHTYNIDCFFEGKLKYDKNDEKSHEIGSYPVIIPFAQEDMISAFIEGIDPKISQLSLHTLNQTLKNYFESIIQSIASTLSQEISEEEANHTIDKMNEEFNKTRMTLLDNYEEEMRKYTTHIHIEPILTTVSILPKNELGEMAEALVNLTSLKRRVTTDKETVGGPTDVALISKGDGFIWIKRKHYFEPELNPDFFAQKYGLNWRNYERRNGDE